MLSWHFPNSAPCDQYGVYLLDQPEFTVCVCSMHQNNVLLGDAIDWDVNYKNLINKVVCDSSNKDCMMHHC